MCGWGLDCFFLRISWTRPAFGGIHTGGARQRSLTVPDWNIAVGVFDIRPIVFCFGTPFPRLVQPPGSRFVMGVVRLRAGNPQWSSPQHSHFEALGLHLNESKLAFPYKDDYASCEYWEVSSPPWIPLSLIMSYPVIRLVRVLRLTARCRRGLCVRCGYNLAGNISGVCPECGTASKKEMENNDEVGNARTSEG